MSQIKSLTAIFLVALFGCLIGVEVWAAPTMQSCENGKKWAVTEKVAHSDSSAENEEADCADPCHLGQCHFGHCAFAFSDSLFRLSLFSASAKNHFSISTGLSAPALEGLRRPPRLPSL